MGWGEWGEQGGKETKTAREGEGGGGPLPLKRRAIRCKILQRRKPSRPSPPPGGSRGERLVARSAGHGGRLGARRLAGSRSSGNEAHTPTPRLCRVATTVDGKAKKIIIIKGKKWC